MDKDELMWASRDELLAEIERLQSLCDSISDDSLRSLKEVERLRAIIDAYERERLSNLGNSPNG